MRWYLDKEKKVNTYYLFLEKIRSSCSKNPCGSGKCFPLNDLTIPHVCLCPNREFGFSCPGEHNFLVYILISFLLC